MLIKKLNLSVTKKSLIYRELNWFSEAKLLLNTSETKI